MRTGLVAAIICGLFPTLVAAPRPSHADSTPTSTAAARAGKKKPTKKVKRARPRRRRRVPSRPTTPPAATTPGATSHDVTPCDATATSSTSINGVPAADDRLLPDDEGDEGTDEDEPVEEGEAPPDENASAFEVGGFVLARMIRVGARDNDLARLLPQPTSPRSVLDIDVQPKLRLSPELRLAGDLTLYLSTTAPKALYLVNELFAEVKLFDALYVHAGRRRVIWGSGLAANPTDLLNPPKNPLDVDEQRMGALLAPLVELVTPWVTLTVLASPTITTNRFALPTGVHVDELRAAGRLYALLFRVDTNLIYYYDLATRRHHGGLSLARYVGDHVEAHVEALVSQGASRPMLAPDIAACGGASTPGFRHATPAVIGGARLDLADRTFVAVEYLFSGNGYDRAGYRALRNQLPCVTEALLAQPPPPQYPLGHPIYPTTLYLRRHYAIVSFQRPHLTRERLAKVAVDAVAATALEDRSWQLRLRVAVELAQQATVGVTGALWIGRRDSELGAEPQRDAAFVDLRVGY